MANSMMQIKLRKYFNNINISVKTFQKYYLHSNSKQEKKLGIFPIANFSDKWKIVPRGGYFQGVLESTNHGISKENSVRVMITIT
jgi:hypothetical protein